MHAGLWSVGGGREQDGTQTDSVEDIVEGSPHPSHLITLGQFRELCLDCGITCRDVLFAAVGREFFKSCRKDCLFSGKTAEADGTTVFSVQDKRNPHDPRNEAHVFEYLEVMIRVANLKFLKKEKTVAKRFGLMMKENLKKHKTPNHVILADGKNDKERWETLNPEVQDVLAKMGGGIDYLYRYFALREDLDSGVTTAAELNRAAEDEKMITNFWNAVDAGACPLLLPSSCTPCTVPTPMRCLLALAGVY